MSALVETVLPMRPKILTIWLLLEKVCQCLAYTINFICNIRVECAHPLNYGRIKPPIWQRLLTWDFPIPWTLGRHWWHPEASLCLSFLCQVAGTQLSSVTVALAIWAWLTIVGLIVCIFTQDLGVIFWTQWKHCAFLQQLYILGCLFRTASVLQFALTL